MIEKEYPHYFTDDDREIIEHDGKARALSPEYNLHAWTKGTSANSVEDRIANHQKGVAGELVAFYWSWFMGADWAWEGVNPNPDRRDKRKYPDCGPFDVRTTPTNDAMIIKDTEVDWLPLRPFILVRLTWRNGIFHLGEAVGWRLAGEAPDFNLRMEKGRDDGWRIRQKFLHSMPSLWVEYKAGKVKDYRS